MEDLPSNYDLIVIGTGMPECIIAAAAARAGKSVLHLDRNNFYGGDWASFNFEQLLSWIEEQKNTVCESKPGIRLLEATWLEQLDDNERLVLCPKKHSTVSNLVQHTYASERRPVPDLPVVEPQAEGTSEVQQSEDGNAQIQKEDEPTGDGAEQLSAGSASGGDIAAAAAPSNNDGDPENECDTAEQETSSAGTSSGAAVTADEHDEKIAPASHEEEDSEPQIQELTMEDMHDNRRKFNIDLSPKLLFSRGSLVELLISSNIARYAEFQSVNRILTYINGHLEQVPCSRADVFSTKNVSVVEKRMLMKLLTFCMEYQKHPEEYRGFEGRPFIEFLRSRKVTENIEHYVLHAIAMVDDTCPTLQGLTATQRFMDSLGRYGNSPFLCTCYGSAELPQCFCRLCAVFGGIYYLKRDADAVIIDSENHCAGIISHGRKLKCQSLVMEYSYAPLDYIPNESPQMVSRAVYITDASIMPAERQQNTLLRLPPISGVCNAITVLEFGSLSYVCPDKFYVVHMITQSFGNPVEEEFKAAEENLFEINSEGDSEASGDNDAKKARIRCEKPKILWCLYYKQKDISCVNLNSKTPNGVFLTSASDSQLDYEYAVKEAMEIFERMYPGEEFLPRAPDPEDIVMDDTSNPGEGTTVAHNENDNIENDHYEGDSKENNTSENSEEQETENVGSPALKTLATEALKKDATM